MLDCKKPEDLPGMLVHAIHRARANAVAAELHARGLADVGSPMILFILDNHGKEGEIASQRELAETLRVSPAAIATSLKSLERLGYVEKKVDEQDGRRNRVLITEKGKAAVKQCFELFDEIDRRMTEGISPEEQQTFIRLQKKVLDNLRVWDKSEKGGCCP